MAAPQPKAGEPRRETPLASARAGDPTRRFTRAGARLLAIQKAPPEKDTNKLNQTLIATERALLTEKGLPGRPWFRHSIYAPGQYTGYAAVVIPGVNEALDAKSTAVAPQQFKGRTQRGNCTQAG